MEIPESESRAIQAKRGLSRWLLLLEDVSLLTIPLKKKALFKACEAKLKALMSSGLSAVLMIV